MQSVQDSLTLAIETIAITALLFVAIDIVNQARFFGGYQIPAGWQPSAICASQQRFAITTETNLPVNIKTHLDSTPVPVFSDPWLIDQETTVELSNAQDEPTQQPE